MGSTETTDPPRAVSEELNDAGPSPQPSMRQRRSCSERLNIAWYSPNDRPQGTMLSSSKLIELARPNANAQRRVASTRPLKHFVGRLCPPIHASEEQERRRRRAPHLTQKDTKLCAP